MGEPYVADELLDAVLEKSRDAVQVALRRAQYVGDPMACVRALAGAVLDVVLRDPNQQAELIERLSAENRSLRDRASKAEASNRRLSDDVSRLAQRCQQLEREQGSQAGHLARTTNALRAAEDALARIATKKPTTRRKRRGSRTRT
ncbi:MAG TPA: hypothetical protein VFZ61_03590 [Polyangiales bacterium]